MTKPNLLDVLNIIINPYDGIIITEEYLYPSATRRINHFSNRPIYLADCLDKTLLSREVSDIDFDCSTHNWNIHIVIDERGDV